MPLETRDRCERRQGTVCDAGMVGLGGIYFMIVLTPCTTVKLVKISLERTLLITYLAPSRVTVGRASVKCKLRVQEFSRGCFSIGKKTSSARLILFLGRSIWDRYATVQRTQPTLERSNALCKLDSHRL